jgi:SAM-dependent methyltransferase
MTKHTPGVVPSTGARPQVSRNEDQRIDLVGDQRRLEQLGAEHYSEHQADVELGPLVGYLRVLGLPDRARVVVVGCGPKAASVQNLLARGYDAIGVEPLPGSHAAACRVVGADRMVLGTAEDLALPSGTCDVVLLEFVMEHVDSPDLAMAEAFRVLKPGGIVYVSTTNRNRFSLTGSNFEFRVPFYNWFPASVKEGYVLRQLHYDPTLADYTPRPAVHWYSFARLCALGRRVGFAWFYAPIDLMEDQGGVRGLVVRACRRNPWLRAALLLQRGGNIFMVKRP